MGSKNFTGLYVGVPAAEKIGLNDGNPFLRGFCTLTDPLSVPVFEPNGLSLLYVSLLISFLFLGFF